MRLREKVALITGATSGIGKAAAILFAKEGAKVVVVGRDLKRGEEAVKEIKSNGGEAFFVQADVSRAADAKKTVEEATKKYGKVDVLFNNAGLVLVKPLIEMDEEEWDRVIDTNLKGAFLLSKYVVPKMIENRGGIIINTASVFGFVAAPNYVAYCASKGGIISLTKAMALELAAFNIRVNCICPGSVSTPMSKYEVSILSRLRGVNEEQILEEIDKSQPLGGWIKPEQIGQAALFLASNESFPMTGEALIIDGGFTLQ
jgi:3-hydroxybutyrate dehydrogenase